MRKRVAEATNLPWRNGPRTALDRFFEEKGYLPALGPDEEETIPEVHPFERRQAVAVSLECAYDAYALALMARELGKEEDAAAFLARARNYRTLYNPANGFMSPRGADGAWIAPFDPKLSGGQGGRAYYAECNAWTYTWSVQHDVAGLIDLMGGRERFVERLDRLFIEPCDNAKWHFLGQFPDSTGLMGQFVTGNEPSFHIPYLYNWAGAPWKTQRRIRQMMDIWFDDTPLGLCGDEDGGAMSAWHIFNSIGFLPTCPGEPYYALGSPVFEHIELHPPDGPVVTITAEGSSPQNKYIQRAELNGVPHPRPWFPHDAIKDGGELTLVMGPRPNKAWGSRPEDAPPSMSDRNSSPSMELICKKTELSTQSILTAGELRVVFERTLDGIRLQSLFDTTTDCEFLSAPTLPLFTLKLRHCETKEELQFDADSGWGQVAIEPTVDGAELGVAPSESSGSTRHCSCHHG